jgi:hypothetical protein
VAIRTWAVHPDESGEVPRQAMGEALMDGEALLARAGGMLTVVTQRMPTGFPNEMVTVGAVFEWRDRTDARPQAERPAYQEPLREDPSPEELEAALEATSEENPDGFTPEADEDLAAVPERLR